MSRPVAIVGALHAELAEILAAMPDEQQVRLGGRTFWRGHWQAHEVVVAVSGMGKAAAATTTALLLDHFDASHVLMSGVAGGLAPVARVGDVIVAQALVQHDVDARPLLPRWQLPGQTSPRIATDGVLTQVLQAAAQDAVTWLPKLLDAQTLAQLGLHSPAVHSGLMLSGDQFVGTQAASDALRTDWPDAWCVDMETAAVAQVCQDFGVPFGAVRTISDRADDTAHVDFEHFLTQVARFYSTRILRKALNLL